VVRLVEVPYGRVRQFQTAEDALAALPGTTLTIPASISHDITIGLTFKSWVRVYDIGYQGRSRS
jgi:hypothetical protein